MLAELEAAGATLVPVPAAPGGGSSPGGNRGIEGWARYIERNPGFPYATGNHLYASPLVLPYSQQNLQTTPRMTEAQVQAWMAHRDQYKETITGWMDAEGVDAVVYPGFLSDVYNNDSATNQLSSDRGTGIPVSSAGIPTVTVPVGQNPHGYSISLQIVGRAFDDAAVLGMGYALEQQTDARTLSTFAPPLEYRPGAPANATPRGQAGPPAQAGPPQGWPHEWRPEHADDIVHDG
jgi:amidase